MAAILLGRSIASSAKPVIRRERLHVPAAVQREALA
jgi:hypothetical protein